MKERDFKALVARIMAMKDGEDTAFAITEDLSTLSAKQRVALLQAFEKKKIPTLGIEQQDTSVYTQDIWNCLAAVIKLCGVATFVLGNAKILRYEENQWKMLSSTLMNVGVKKLGLTFSGLYAMKSVQWSLLFQVITKSAIKKLDVSGNALSEMVDDSLKTFFEQVIAYGLTELSCGNDSTLGPTTKSFWSLCEHMLPKSKLVHLDLDSITLYKIIKENWLKFCVGLKGSSITSLSIRHNRLYNFSPEQWGWFFQGLGITNVESLDITEFHSLQLKGDSWKIFCEGLRNSRVTTLHYRADQFDRDPLKIQTISEILEQNRKKNLDKVESSQGKSQNERERITAAM